MTIRARQVLAGVLAVLLAAGCSTAPRQPAAVMDKKNRAAEYTTFGNRSFQEGDYEGALTFFQQALAANLSVDNETGVIQSLGSLGKVHLAQGDLGGARELFERASRLATEQPDPALHLQTAVSLAELALRQNDAAGAKTLLLAQAVDDKRLAGSPDLAIYYHTLAVALRKLGELDGAVADLELALAINRKLKLPREIASNLIVLASIHTARGELEQARTEASQALDLDKQVENSLGIAQDLLALGLVCRKLGLAEDSFRYLERAYGAYDAMGQEAGRVSVLVYLPEAARQAGRIAEAEAYERLRAGGTTP